MSSIKFNIYVQTTPQILFLPGLEKTQILLKKPAGRLNTGFFRQNRFFKTDFFMETVLTGGQNQ
jgi:hypothetical protein